MITLNKLLGLCLLISSSTVFAAYIGIPSPTTASSPSPTTAPTALHFQSAQTCRSCHPAIYEEWRESWMANAFTNSVFQADLKRYKAFTKDTGESPMACLRCHAPAALMTSDDTARQTLSEEGVTCEICHKVAKVKKRDDRFHLIIDPRNVQYSKNKKTVNTPHAVRFSEALTDSSLCAGCHLDIKKPDIPLERTYQEWASSTYAKTGMQCQTCHMPAVPGPATVEHLSSMQVNLSRNHASHRFPGGHSDSSLLSGAASFSLRYEKNKKQLNVKIINNRVGHNFPTGGAHPAKLVLEIKFLNTKDEIVHRADRIYEFTLLDKSNARFTAMDAQVPTIKDTTLKPLETRNEVFNLTTIPNFQVIEAALVYYLLPAKDAQHIDPSLLKDNYNPVIISRRTLDLSESGAKVNHSY